MNPVAADPSITPMDNDLEVVVRNDLTVLARYESLLVENGIDTLDGIFSVKGESLGKAGLSDWRQRVRLTLDHGGRTETMYLKRFQHPPASARRVVLGRGTGARSIAGMEWNWARQLAQEGIPCAKVVAFGEELRGNREIRSAVLLAAVPGISLETWMSAPEAGDRVALRRISASLAWLAARLHANGYVHRDLYLSHVFFDPANDRKPLHLIDLQRVFRPTCCPGRWIVKDLAALNVSSPDAIVSKADRVRWLKSYLGVAKLDGPAKCLAYRIVGKTISIARHEHRRQRRLAGEDQHDRGA